MLLVEELTFLLRSPEGAVLRAPSGAAPAHLVTGAALLLDLVRAGLVELDGDHATPTGAPATDAVLDDAVRRLKKRRRTAIAVSRLSATTSVVQRLRDQGLLGEERGGFLRAARHPVIDLARHGAAVASLQALADGDDEVPAREAALLALVGVSAVRGLLVLPESPVAAVEQAKRLRAARCSSPEVEAVLAAVDDLASGEGPMTSPDLDDFDFDL